MSQQWPYISACLILPKFGRLHRTKICAYISMVRSSTQNSENWCMESSPLQKSNWCDQSSIMRFWGFVHHFQHRATFFSHQNSQHCVAFNVLNHLKVFQTGLGLKGALGKQKRCDNYLNHPRIQKFISTWVYSRSFLYH